MVSQAQEKGITKGTAVVITGQHKKGMHIAVHKFNIGQIVSLERDDGSFSPLFTDGKDSWYVRLDCVELVKPQSKGPKSNPNIKWSDAPEGATHYSGYEGHTNRWHKLDEKGNWYFFRQKFVSDSLPAQWVGPYHNACAETQEPIPVDLNTSLKDVKAKLETVQKRLTRTGSKKGRVEKRLAEVNEAFDALTKEHATLRQREAELQLAVTAVEKAKAEEVKVYYTLEQIYQISKNPSQWKRGMKVKSVHDSEVDIEIGDVFVLTDDVVKSDGVEFLDNANDQRYRDSDDYELVWEELVGKPVIK